MKLGIVGTNFISDRLYHATTLTNGVTATAVFSRNLDTGRAFAEKHTTVTSVFDNFDAFLASDIDAVYVASPIIAHRDQSVAAMKMGKHVLSEKLMAHTHAAFSEMRTTATETERVLLEAMRPAHDPAYDTVRELLFNVGNIRTASLEFCQYSSRYDRFKAGIMTNAFNPKMYNSALSDIGVYPLHTALMLFGSSPKLRTASATLLDGGFEGDGRLTLGYDGFDVDIVYSKIRDTKTPSIIVGEQGSISIDKISQPTAVTYTAADGTRHTYNFAPPEDNNMVYELSAFRDMCDGKIDYRPFLDLTDAAQQIIDRAYVMTGASAAFPSESEKA